MQEMTPSWRTLWYTTKGKSNLILLKLIEMYKTGSPTWYEGIHAIKSVAFCDTTFDKSLKVMMSRVIFSIPTIHEIQPRE